MVEKIGESFDNPYPPQGDYVPVRTIATPLPPVSGRLIQRRPPAESTDCIDTDPANESILEVEEPIVVTSSNSNGEEREN